MNNKTLKKFVCAAMLCAIAYIMVVIGRVPVIQFLSYDPKDIIITLGGLIWGPLMSCLISIVVSIIEMVTISTTGLIGCIMNIISTCSFACTAAFIYKKKRTLSGAIIGLLAGSVTMIVVMLLWNYLITPLYMEVPRETVVTLLVPMFLPFNALKAGLNAAFTFLLYRPVISALRHAHLVDMQSGTSKKKFPLGFVLLAIAIIITCILFILSFQGII